MKDTIRNIIVFIDDFVTLCKQSYTSRQKLWILYTYLCLLCKAILARKRKKIVHSMIGVWNFTSFSHQTTAYLFKEIFVKGTYAFNLSDKSPVFYDLGANIGMATLFFKWRYPSATIHAFEPDPETYKLLELNITGNHLSSVYLHNIAIGGSSCRVEFFTNSVEAGSLRMSVGRERASGEKKSVPMQTLSSFLTTASVYVKIDTEGSETDTIRELANSGKLSNIKEMIIEYHHRINSESSRLSEILTPLEEAGFEYELECANQILVKKDVYQNVMLFCYQK